jgi:hypothetical protein
MDELRRSLHLQLLAARDMGLVTDRQIFDVLKILTPVAESHQDGALNEIRSLVRKERTLRSGQDRLDLLVELIPLVTELLETITKSDALRGTVERNRVRLEESVRRGEQELAEGGIVSLDDLT